MPFLTCILFMQAAMSIIRFTCQTLQLIMHVWDFIMHAWDLSMHVWDF